jgi:hypothetical protein
MRLYDTPELRRKYVFNFASPTKAEISFYISPSDAFVFSVKDIHGETYSLDLPVSGDAIPLNRLIFLYCGIGISQNTTEMRILVDGKPVADRKLDFKLDLGANYWQWTHATFGADQNGKNNTPFFVSAMGFSHATMSEWEINKIQSRINQRKSQVNQETDAK